MELKDKVVLLTGGSKGYGKGIAKALQKQGCKVYITGRNKNDLDATAKDLGVIGIQSDVSSPEDWDTTVQKILSTENKIDILINNAGSGVSIKPLDEQEDKDIQTSIGTNLLGPIYGCKRLAKVMKEQKSGYIINISSVCETNAWPGYSVYSAAKGGLGLLSRCLHTELRPFNIRVTQLIPSWGDTEFSKAANLPNQEEEVLKKVMKVEEMGDFVVSILKTPEHLVIPVVRVQPMIQDITPF
jgi:NAD(P)-dependent dehydrogenase (short-subunit alcohol dehydrogenase family)